MVEVERDGIWSGIIVVVGGLGGFLEGLLGGGVGSLLGHWGYDGL